jgi:methyl-accepting chemotaxis protein
MAEIISSVNRVTDIINEISAASSEQSIGIDQVNQAIMQMDGVTQQNASLVEESAAAAASMAQEAQALMKMVGEFKLTKADSSPLSKGKAARPATQSPAKAAPIKVAHSKYNQVPASAGSDWDEF